MNMVSEIGSMMLLYRVFERLERFSVKMQMFSNFLLNIFTAMGAIYGSYKSFYIWWAYGWWYLRSIWSHERRWWKKGGFWIQKFRAATHRFWKIFLYRKTSQNSFFRKLLLTEIWDKMSPTQMTWKTRFFINFSKTALRPKIAVIYLISTCATILKGGPGLTSNLMSLKFYKIIVF